MHVSVKHRKVIIWFGTLKAIIVVIRTQRAKCGMIKMEGTAVSLPLVGLLNLVLFSSVYFTLSYNFSIRRVFWGFTIFIRSG